MKLVVFYPMVCTHEVGCTSFKLWIPPLSFMKRRTDIKRIIHTRRDFNIPAKLYKLFSPVDCYSYSKSHQYPAQNWIAGSERIYSSNNAKNSKEMPPKKFQYLFGLIPYLVDRVHDLILLNHNQDTITLTKHTPNIPSKNRALNFHEWPAFEGGQFYGLS